MKYVSKIDEERVVTVTKAKKDTTIESELYGEILVTKGNYILEDENGTKTGITEKDLAAQYTAEK